MKEFIGLLTCVKLLFFDVVNDELLFDNDDDIELADEEKPDDEEEDDDDDDNNEDDDMRLELVVVVNVEAAKELVEELEHSLEVNSVVLLLMLLLLFDRWLFVVVSFVQLPLNKLLELLFSGYCNLLQGSCCVWPGSNLCEPILLAPNRTENIL